MSDLETLVLDIVTQHDGIMLADIVTAALKTGYIHTGSDRLSAAVYAILHSFAHTGSIIKQEDDATGVRRYHPAA